MPMINNGIIKRRKLKFCMKMKCIFYNGDNLLMGLYNNDVHFDLNSSDDYSCEKQTNVVDVNYNDIGFM